MRKIFLSLLCILWLSGCESIAEEKKTAKFNDDYEIIIRLPNDELVYGRGSFSALSNGIIRVYLHGGKMYRVHANNVAIIGEWEDDE